VQKTEIGDSNLHSAQNVKDKAIKSMKWSVLFELMPKIIVPITTLIFVKILLPEDFGIMTIATIFVGLAGTFQDFGLAKALVREIENKEESADVVFWSNVVLSAVIYFLIFISAPLISLFFKEPRLTDVLRVLCLEIVVSSLIAVQYAILQRDFKFKKIFLSGIGFVVAPIFITVPLAILHFGVWALVLGSLSGYVVQAIILWVQSDWRPKFRFSIPVAKKIFNFGAWVTAESFILWLLSYGDSGAIGYFLDVKDVGIYYIGLTFITLIFGTMFNPILSVAYSSFSKLQNSPDDLRNFFVRSSHLLAILCIPMGAGLILTAFPVYTIFFQNNWAGIQVVIALLAAVQMVAWLVGISPTLYRAIGRPDINFKIGVASLFFYIPAYIYFAQFGLFIFCVGRLLVAIGTDIIHLVVMNRVLKIHPRYLFDITKIPLLAVIPMSILVYFAVNFSGSFLGWLGALKLLGIIVLGAGVYAGALYLISKEYFKQSFSLFLKIIR